MFLWRPVMILSITKDVLGFHKMLLDIYSDPKDKLQLRFAYLLRILQICLFHRNGIF